MGFGSTHCGCRTPLFIGGEERPHKAMLLSLTILIGISSTLVTSLPQPWSQPSPGSGMLAILCSIASCADGITLVREPMEKRNAEPDLGGHQLSITSNMDLLRARLARAAVRRRQGGQGSREDLWGGMERAQLVNIG